MRGTSSTTRPRRSSTTQCSSFSSGRRARGRLSTGVILNAADDQRDDEKALVNPPHELAAPKAFAELGLIPELLDAVRDAGYTTPTPIQAEAIPLALRGRDIIGLAQTGTGKTAGFTLPIIQRLLGGART